MTMTLPIAELRITRDLRQAEAALDDALLKQNSLLASLITARREVGANPFVAHAELMRLVKSQQSLLSASGDLARVHGGLKEIGREYGRVVHDCPPNEPTGHNDTDLNDAGEVFPFQLKAA